MSYYQDHYKEYIEQTFKCDMSEQYRFFEKHLDKDTTDKRILDIGCGSGRDSLYFKSKGYEVYAIDTEEVFIKHAKEIGIEHAYQMDIRDIEYFDFFDAIWASASLLHISSKELTSVLSKCANALKDDGVMYASFKYGDFEGIRDGRYYLDLTKRALRRYLTGTGLKIVDTLLTKDVRENNNTSWLNVILIKEDNDSCYEYDMYDSAPSSYEGKTRHSKGVKMRIIKSRGRRKRDDYDNYFSMFYLEPSDTKEEEHLSFHQSKEKRKTNNEINYSLVSEKKIKKGSDFIISFAIYENEYRRIIENIMESFDDPKEKEGTIENIKEGCGVSIRMSSPNISTINDEYHFIWQGKYHICDLSGFVPKEYDGDAFLISLDIFVNGIKVTRIKTIIDLKDNKMGKMIFHKDDIKSIFFSYSSIDRDIVLSLVKDIKESFGNKIDFFLDVLSLRAGDKWEERLYKEIDDKDAFCLIWSKNASKSEWVEKEWKYALKNKGIDAINPINLDANDKSVPIPKELSSIHFAYYPLMFE